MTYINKDTINSAGSVSVCLSQFFIIIIIFYYYHFFILMFFFIFYILGTVILPTKMCRREGRSGLKKEKERVNTKRE